MTADPIALLREVAAEDPIAHCAEDGNYCFYCGVQWRFYPQPQTPHTPECLHRRIVEALAELDAAPKLDPGAADALWRGRLDAATAREQLARCMCGGCVRGYHLIDPRIEP